MAATTTTFPWKRNLAVLWVAQVVTTLGFSFTFPFYPIFFQSLGVEEVERAAFLSGLSGWMMGVGMGLFAPFWGIIGDRYGRRRNIIRAMLLGGTFLVLSGYSQNPTQLVVSRFLIGATSGVVPTIMALVAGHTPRDRLPLATGLTMAALFLGTALGPLFGGVIFDHFGMVATFWATGLALFAATALVVLFAREDFKRPERTEGRPFRAFGDLWRLASSATFFPLLLMGALVMIGALLITPAIAGIVATTGGGSERATDTGIVFMAIGVSASISAVTMGWLAGRLGLRPVFLTAAALASAAYAAPYFADTYVQLILLVAMASLFQGGISGMLNGMIAMRTPREQHGAAFGASQVAHSMGVAFGPLLGGATVVAFGLRSVFLVNVGVFALIFVVAVVLLRSGALRLSPSPRAANEAPPG